jgi:hypothetical protein
MELTYIHMKVGSVKRGNNGCTTGNTCRRGVERKNHPMTENVAFMPGTSVQQSTRGNLAHVQHAVSIQ